MENHDKKSAVEAVRPVIRTSLSDEIIDQILDLIARNVLKPGDRLPPERELCKRFGVGRTSLREALRSLSVMGILDGRVGEGTFVRQDNEEFLRKTLERGLLLNAKKVQDLVETRLMLESETAAGAAQRATEADLRAIEETVNGMEAALAQPEQFLEFDLQFHLAVARATQNSILYSLLSMTRAYLKEWIEGSLAESGRDGQRARLSLEQHQTIFRALKQGDPEAARQAMGEHILSSSVDLQSHIDGAASDREG